MLYCLLSCITPHAFLFKHGAFHMSLHKLTLQLTYENERKFYAAAKTEGIQWDGVILN